MTERLVVFDWDGTLADSIGGVTEAIALAIEHAGLPPRSRARIREVIGLRAAAGVHSLYPDAPTAAQRALRSAYALPSVRACFEQPATLFPGAYELIERLGAQQRLLAVATGKGRAGLERDLAAHGLTRCFACIRTADDGPGKPAPHMLEAILAETGSRPREAVVVGDTLYDLQMAAAAGVDAIGVSWGVAAHATLRTAPSRAIVDCIADLSTLLLHGR